MLTVDDAGSRTSGPRRWRSSAPTTGRTPACATSSTMRASVYLGGRLQGIEPPTHYDFQHLRDTPQELRARFRKLGWRRVIAFQTRNPMHRAHQELTFRAAQAAEANLLIHPVVGMTKPGDVDHYTRVRCYERLLRPLPRADHDAEPPAARHAHGRAARGGLARDHPQELRLHPPDRRPRPRRPRQRLRGQAVLRPLRRAGAVRASTRTSSASRWCRSTNLVYCAGPRAVRAGGRGRAGRDRARRSPAPSCAAGCSEGLEIPDWFSFPEVVEELRRTHPPRHEQGFTVFFTGLSGSGKSTIANALLVKLLELGGRPVTLLDGDHGAQAPVLRARLLARAPRPQHPAHRLRRQRDHQERRHRDLRADRALRRDARQGARA